MTGYYDYVLGLIPAGLLGVTAFLNLVGLSVTAALPVGAGIALALMVHAMFVRSPLPGADSVGGRSPSGTTPATGSGGPGTAGTSAGSE